MISSALAAVPVDSAAAVGVVSAPKRKQALDIVGAADIVKSARWRARGRGARGRRIGRALADPRRAVTVAAVPRSRSSV